MMFNCEIRYCYSGNSVKFVSSNETIMKKGNLFLYLLLVIFCVMSTTMMMTCSGVVRCMHMTIFPCIIDVP